MHKTIQLLFLSLIISGMVFTACLPAGVDLDDLENTEQVEEVEETEEEVEEDEDGEEEEEVEKVEEEKTADVEKKESVEVKVDVEAEAKVEVAASEYVDGTYSQVGSYQSPAGAETITVNVTVKDDVVSGLNITANATNDVSIKLQKLFIDGANAEVVGKKLSEIEDLGIVNGSSLTPKGFNAALAEVKAQAANDGA